MFSVFVKIKVFEFVVSDFDSSTNLYLWFSEISKWPKCVLNVNFLLHVHFNVYTSYVNFTMSIQMLFSQNIVEILAFLILFAF